MEYPLFIKIVMVGDSGVGKTSIVNRFCREEFDENVSSTIGCDFFAPAVRLANGFEARLQIWDIAGADRFRSFSKMYLRGALGCAIVCEHQDIRSIESLKEWMNIVQENFDFQMNDKKGIPIFLLENKIDKAEPYIELNSERPLEAKFRELKFDNYFQTSAKENKNIKNAFTSMTEEILKRGLLKIESYNYENIKMKSLKLKSSKEGKKNSKCPC